MPSISLETTDSQFIIRIDKSQIDEEILLRLIDSLRLETMAEKVDLNEAVEDLGKEIKKEWWKANKDRFIPKSEQ